MSDFVDKPLNKRMNMGNPISRIERVERAVGPAPSASVESLSDLSTETGIIRGDLIIAPASGVETEEVTSTDFTGVFMSGDAKTFNGEDWNFGGVNAGVFQAGFNSLTGKFVAGAGAVTADENGVGIQSNSSGSVAQINSLSFLNGSTIYAYLASYFDSTSNVTALSTRSISGKNSSLFLEAVSPSGNDSIASLRAQTGTGSNALLRITAPNGGQVAIESNALQEDVDTNVYGTSSTPISTHDAGDNSLRIRRHLVLEQQNLTIASGAITVTNPYHAIDTEAAAATDDLTTINGTVQAGQILVLRTVNSGRDVTVKDGTGNIQLAGGDRVLDNIKDKLTLIWDGVDWCELAFASNV